MSDPLIFEDLDGYPPVRDTERNRRIQEWFEAEVRGRLTTAPGGAQVFIVEPDPDREDQADT